MKKFTFLAALAICFSAISQPITNISVIKSHTVNYLDQGFFIQVTVDSALQNNKWMVTDATGTIRCNFANVSSPNIGQNITIVGKGVSDGGFEVLVNLYYNTSNPPNITTSISTLHANPQNDKPVLINGEITGVISGFADDYYLEDASGVIKADWGILMNIPDFFTPIVVWGITDYDPNSYIDIDVWAWYYTGIPGIEEFDLSTLVYPNPVSTTLNLNLPNEVTSLVIYTLLGQPVLESPNTNYLDLSSLVTGEYVLALFREDLLVGQTKLIKQ